MKRCKKCGIDKEESDFYTKRNGTLRSPCKECQSRYKTVESSRLAQKRFWNKNKERLVKTRRCRLYGITEIQFEDLSKKQEGKCDICMKSLEGPKNCHIDHNHETKEVRGLLCSSCNKALGLFKENPDTLQAAINYLHRHK